MSEPECSSKKLWAMAGWAALLAAVLAYALLLLRTAWMSDDAYITLRTVDNFVNGFGLRWNVAERVQPYTHPLWMFLLMGVYSFTRESFLTGIFVSMAVSMTAFAVALFNVARNVALALIGAAALCMSHAFMDYSTSGLENPLTNLLLAAFVAVYIQPAPSLRRLFLLSLLTALGVLNRMDALLLFAPALAWAWFEMRSWKALILVAFGFVPFVAWEVFSVIYYGFPFPNTAYAKLGTGIASGELMRQGMFYYLNSLLRDPLTLAFIAAGAIAPLIAWQKRLLPLSAGILLYLAYIVKIGGDFMGGRFFEAPLFLAVLTLMALPLRRNAWIWGPPILAGVLLIGLVIPFCPARTGADFGNEAMKRLFFKDRHGIGDERMFWFQVAGLAQWQPGKDMPSHSYAETGRGYKRLDTEFTKVHGSVGYRGYFAGPKVHIIDYYALADPLLARLPAKYAPNWRIGHFTREIPDGYETCAAGGPDTLTDPQLAQYFDTLSLIARGPIWSAERWKAILRMNLGKCDDLIDWDRYRFPDIKKLSLENLQSQTATPIPANGISIEFSPPRHEPNIELTLSGNGDFRILIMSGAKEAAAFDAMPRTKQSGQLFYTFQAPNATAQTGYTALRVIPFRGDKKARYEIGQLTLKNN